MSYVPFDDRERIVREAAERWAPRGRCHPVRRRDHLQPSLRGGHPRPPRPARVRLRDRQRPRLRRLAVSRRPGRGRGSRADRSPRSSAPYFDEVSGRSDPACSTRSATSTSSSATSSRTFSGRPGGGAGALRAAPPAPHRLGHGAGAQHERLAPGGRRDVPVGRRRRALPGARGHRTLRPAPMPTGMRPLRKWPRGGVSCRRRRGDSPRLPSAEAGRVAVALPDRVAGAPAARHLTGGSVVMTIDDAAIERLVAEARRGMTLGVRMIFDQYHEPVYRFIASRVQRPIGRGGPDAARLRQGPGSAAAL